MRWIWRSPGLRGLSYWVGYTAGVGLAGLLGIAVCLILAENGGVDGQLAEIAFLWSAVSLLLLGLIVALSPYFVFEWSRVGDSDE